MNLNATDRITILYNFILVIFIFIFRVKIAAYAYHLAFNLSVILLVLLLSFRRRSSMSVCMVSLWYPLVLYGSILLSDRIDQQGYRTPVHGWLFYESGRPDLRQISRLFPPVENMGMHSSTSFFIFFILVII